MNVTRQTARCRYRHELVWQRIESLWLSSLSELGALCERQLHIHGFMHNPDLNMIHLQLAGKALIHVGGDRVVSCFWEGRPPCRPLPRRKRPAGLSALVASQIYCYLISKVFADDTEVVPPQQSSPANDDEPILTHCKKPCAWTLNRLYPIELLILMRINFSQSSPSSQRPRLVIEEALKKASQFNQTKFSAKPKG